MSFCHFLAPPSGKHQHRRSLDRPIYCNRCDCSESCVIHVATLRRSRPPAAAPNIGAGAWNIRRVSGVPVAFLSRVCLRCPLFSSLPEMSFLCGSHWPPVHRSKHHSQAEEDNGLIQSGRSKPVHKIVFSARTK
jgi:hypothetical protein